MLLAISSVLLCTYVAPTQFHGSTQAFFLYLYPALGRSQDGVDLGAYPRDAFIVRWIGILVVGTRTITHPLSLTVTSASGIRGYLGT